MWSPTHIQVTVQRAKGLLTKGKNGTNNCFVTIGLGKDKYQTSIKDKAEANVNWNEECELKIPDQGNRAELTLTCLHRNNLGIDEFLGQVTLPLSEMDVYDRPRSKWLKLESKPGKEKKNKERGELEVRISFIVKSGSLTDLSKKDKHKSSIGQLASSVGGSLLSIGQIEKRKSIKKFAKSLGSKMHLNGKKKSKDGDDISINGSFASIGTPNSSLGGSRRYGQHAGDADPGVISEDEDEFVFDNLSHKSSGSSINIRSSLQPPTQNYVPRNPSPLLASTVATTATSKKLGGKQQSTCYEDVVVDAELEKLENDFSIRARTLPPPSKPPRTPQLSVSTLAEGGEKDRNQFDEWETKLYGKHLEIGSSDSLKRHSWESTRVPLSMANEEFSDNIENNINNEEGKMDVTIGNENANAKTTLIDSDSSSSSSDSDSEEEEIPERPQAEKMEEKPILQSATCEEPEERAPKQSRKLLVSLSKDKSQEKIPKEELKIDVSGKKVIEPIISLLSADTEQVNFNQYNASFAKYEQNNKDKIFDCDLDKKWTSSAFIDKEKSTVVEVPQAMPRNRTREIELKKEFDEKKRIKESKLKAEVKTKTNAEVEDEILRKGKIETKAVEEVLAEKEQICPNEKDAKLEERLDLNVQRPHNEKAAMQVASTRDEEQNRLDAKRREEDQKLLNFTVQRSISLEKYEKRIDNEFEQLPNRNWECTTELNEKRIGKYKYSNKRDKSDPISNSSSPKSTERIIIGHEKTTTHAERRSEISTALSKKYEGKSREELMLIANGMENEALLQRQRVKELEDYLDNLLLRVMETHPKILQNPYSRTTSAKSG